MLYDSSQKVDKINEQLNIILTDIIINESRHSTMIDFESENNYVSTVLARRKRFFTRSKNKNTFETFVIEEEFVNKMNQEAISRLFSNITKS